MRALVRLAAYAITSDFDDAEEILAWAYKEEETQKVESPKRKEEFVDCAGVLRMWNETMTGSIPKVREMTKSRAEKIRARVAEMGGWDKAREIIATCYRKINESEFCNGGSGKWTATFDWLFANEKNWVKVMEGNYDDKRKKSDVERLSDEIKKADWYYEQRARLRDAGSGRDSASGWGDDPDEQ